MRCFFIKQKTAYDMRISDGSADVSSSDLRIEANKLLKPMSYIGGAISEWRLLQQLEGHIAPTAIPFETRVGFMKSVELLKEAASDLSMRTSLGVIEAEWEDRKSTRLNSSH